jgi:molybdopterin biosynthesis enzyme
MHKRTESRTDAALLVFDEIFHPIARRLLDRCDAVLRVGGPSAGADEMVQRARDAGKLVVSDVAALS